MVERVVSGTLVELRRAQHEAAMRAEQMDLQLRLASRVWERDVMQLQARNDAAHLARERAADARLTVAHAWLAHALADLAERRLEAKALRHHQQHHQQQHMQGRRTSDEEPSFWEVRVSCRVRACGVCGADGVEGLQVLRWKKGAADEGSSSKGGGREADKRREAERELAQCRAENERLRLLLKRTTHTAQVPFHAFHKHTLLRAHHRPPAACVRVRVSCACAVAGVGGVLESGGRDGADQVRQGGHDVPPLAGTLFP